MPNVCIPLRQIGNNFSYIFLDDKPKPPHVSCLEV